MKNKWLVISILMVIGALVFFVYVDYYNSHYSYLQVYQKEGNYQYLEYKPSPVEFDSAIVSQLTENEVVLMLLEKNYEYVASNCSVVLKYGTYLFKIKCAI